MCQIPAMDTVQLAATMDDMFLIRDCESAHAEE